jgi:hypothetical protein
MSGWLFAWVTQAGFRGDVVLRVLRRLRKLWVPIYLVGCCLVMPAYSRMSSVEPKVESGPKRLVIVLDGVPFQTIADLRAEGAFNSFRSPARMVATFPSLTNPSMIEILGTRNAPGYEDQYYDRERNHLIGGFQDRMRGGSFIRGTFREQFSYHAPALRGSLAYIAQPLGAIIVAQTDVAAFKRAFRASREPLFVAYLGATDSLAHLGGEQPLKSLLRSLDRTIMDLRKESGDELEVDMLSDHGNIYTSQHFVPLNAALEKAGFTIEKGLNGSKKSVVLPRYGLIGSAVLFSDPENREQLARVAANTTGVDFAVFQRQGEEGRAITLVSRRGQARIERRDESFRYLDLGGDPLELKPVVKSMSEGGKLDEEGFGTLDDWWKSTQSHRYPDPLRRLFDGFTEHIQTVGDVLVSFEDGYLIGSPFFGIFARMQATHGNLLSHETEGFAMSTRIEAGSAVRGSDVHRLFGLSQMSPRSHYFSSYGHCAEGAMLAKSLMQLPE